MTEMVMKLPARWKKSMSWSGLRTDMDLGMYVSRMKSGATKCAHIEGMLMAGSIHVKNMR